MPGKPWQCRGATLIMSKENITHIGGQHYPCRRATLVMSGGNITHAGDGVRRGRGRGFWRRGRCRRRRRRGPIDFVWGWPGTEAKKYHDGYGFSNIIAAHGEEAAKRVLEILAHGKYYVDRSERDAYPVVRGTDVLSVKRRSDNFYVVTSDVDKEKAADYARRGGQVENRAGDDA